MQEKLNDIVQVIEDYFVKEVWCFPPPIKDEDYKLSMIAHKIYKLRNTIKEIDNIDKELSEIMTYIENEFKVQILGANIPKRFKKGKIRDVVVLKVYNQLSNLRSS